MEEVHTQYSYNITLECNLEMPWTLRQVIASELTVDESPEGGGGGPPEGGGGGPPEGGGGGPPEGGGGGPPEGGVGGPPEGGGGGPPEPVEWEVHGPVV